MRRNWGKLVDKRRLRVEVAARLTELCALSSIGVVSVDPSTSLGWLRYNAEGEVKWKDIRACRKWLDLSAPELEYMLVRDLYPVDPKSPLVILAEQAE